MWVDLPFKPRRGENEWLPFATFTNDPSDSRDRVVCINLSWDGFVHLMHVPEQGQKPDSFQTNEVRFPQPRRVKLRTYLDLKAKGGDAKVRQDDDASDWQRPQTLAMRAAELPGSN